MSFIVLKKGIYSSFRGFGTFFERHLGINPDGVMDRCSFQLLNLLLRNDKTEEAFEMFYPADSLLFEKKAFIVIGGGDFSPELDGNPIELWKVYPVQIGSVLKFRKKINGNCTYLAVKGGFKNPYFGKMLFPRFSSNNHLLSFFSSNEPTLKLRIVLGKEFKLLDDLSQINIFNHHFSIDINSNRMATRLRSVSLSLVAPIELVTRAVDFGTIQLLPDGQLLILMAGHQTSGGYPVMGNIMEADLPKLAQASPSRLIRFEAVSVEDAEKKHMELKKEWDKIVVGIDYFYKKNEN